MDVYNVPVTLRGYVRTLIHTLKTNKVPLQMAIHGTVTLLTYMFLKVLVKLLILQNISCKTHDF